MKPKLIRLLTALFLSATPALHAVVDDAHSFALEAATPYVRKGFVVREEHWAGWLEKGQQSSIEHQLFKGNQYWFWLASDETEARVTIHVYDSGGRLVDAEAWQSGKTAAVRVTPKRTGTYYIVFSVQDTRLKRTRWAVAYGYK